MHWIPEIVYSQSGDGKASKIPLINVPKGYDAPKVIFLFANKETDETDVNEAGETVPVVESELMQYANINTLRDNLSVQTYNEIRLALGLKSLEEAIDQGKKITDNIRKNLSV
jgi:hypothetical protein